MDQLRSIAGFVAIAGVISSVLTLFGYELRILMWIDLWGTGVGWAIRAGLVVVGAAVFFLLPSGEQAPTTDASPPPPSTD
jgi:hypothetical protein